MMWDIILVKVWLSTQFDMDDLGEASHILGIKLMPIDHVRNPEDL